ncbi:MAG: carbohydrate deacetylase [Thermoanaerobaculia bacterium]
MATAETLLIVNADDLGRTTGVNAGIFEAHRRGIVTSATLMVAYPAAAQAAAELAAHPALGVGLHVALSGGRPVLPVGWVPSLVDSDGRLPPGRDGLGSANPGEVLAEVRAQVDRFQRLTGRLPTHLDGHHHCHRVPAVLEAVVEVANEHDLPVRDAGEGIRRRLERAGIATTDRFVNRFYGDQARLETLLEILAGVGPGTTEVMCHPGRADAELLDGSSYAVEREREVEILTHPDVVRAARRPGVRLADFGALGTEG